MAGPNTARSDGPADAPVPLPAGRYHPLPGRGELFSREVRGPRDAPTLLLLHGWLATSALNWFRVFAPLGRRYRILAPDLRGHGGGIKSMERFRLEDCADDVAALLMQADTGPVIAVGYSMGGPIAQLLWRRHPSLVSGLVLCATSDQMTPGRIERFAFSTATMAIARTTRLGQLSSRLPERLTRRALPREAVDGAFAPSSWARAEMRKHSMRMLMEAGYALSRYDAGSWIHEIDVPTSVVVTLDDQAIPARNQKSMARRIPRARIHSVRAGHILCSRESFAKPLLNACRDVEDRIARESSREIRAARAAY